MLTQIQKQKFLLRGGGCLSAKYIRPKKIRATHITTDFNKSFIHYVEMIETEASVAESKKIITAIQWFIFQEQNIYKLNLDAELIIFYYNLILDGIRRLLQSCSIYFKTDIFKCLYFLQVTAYLSKVIFSFHLHYKLRYMMNRETKNQLLEICDKTQQYLKIEKNNFIQNQLELFLFLTKTSLEIIPTNRNEKEEMLQGCLHEIISLFITMSPKSEILQALYQGACLSYQKQDIPQRKKEYEVFYQLDMLQWEVIGYFQDKDKQYERILEDIISEIEAIYEKLMKSSKNWQDHYFWISMINKILINNPYLTTKRFGELNNPFNIGLNDDNKSGLIIEDYVESNQQIPLRLLDILYQKYKDFLNNDEWKIKQGLIFNIIYISSCSFTDAIISFYQNILIQFWVFEKDQRVRSLLKNSHLISFQKKMFQDNCQTKQESLAREIQQVLKKIDELQESTFYKANLKEMDEIIMQLDEYIKNISEMCEQLGLTTDFANPFKKCVLILEGKRNQMREESVRQLLEIRKLKVFKEAAKNTATSIYVPLKTKERCKNQLNNLVNLEQLDDKFGEVNQFLHEDKTVLLIHGMAGSGKSRAAKKIEEFIWKLNDNNTKIQNYKLIPVYISLASLKNPIFQAVEEALHQDDYGFDDLQLKKCQEMLQKQEFRFVLIMDSYDELKQENMEKNLYITNKLKQNWSNPLVIFTTRSEILTSIHYRNWFAPMENNNIKEIKLLKFDKEQQKEYLKQFVIQSIKLLIFELWESQINIDQIEDINRLELFWEKLQSLLKFDIFKMNSASLLDQQQIEKIILFSKDNEFKALQREEDQRNLSLKLHKLWSVEMYQKMMRQANLTKLVQTPKMMEIVVQVLPQMMDEVTNKNNMKQNFVKNFSLMLKEFLKSQYMFHMYKQQQNTHLMGLENEIEQRYKTETVNDQYDVLEIIVRKKKINKNIFEKKTLLKHVYPNITNKKIRNQGQTKYHIFYTKGNGKQVDFRGWNVDFIGKPVYINHNLELVQYISCLEM